MGDLISQEALMRAVEEFFEEICVYDVAPFEAVSDFESILDSIPYVDAEPVRRWKWLVNGIALQCPLCKKSLVVEQADEGLGYCPFCGKPMGGAE